MGKIGQTKKWPKIKISSEERSISCFLDIDLKTLQLSSATSHLSSFSCVQYLNDKRPILN